MHDLWKTDNGINFGFYAVPRDIDLDSISPKRKKSLNDINYLERYIRTRFHIYEHAMINLFPPSSFWHIQDYKNCIYILLNKNTKSPTIKLKKIVDFLLEFHDIIFEPTIEIENATKKRGDEMRIG